MKQFKWRIYSRESQRCINAFFKQWCSRYCNDEIYEKFCIISEEYITNFFRHVKRNSVQLSWFIGGGDEKSFMGSFYDNGFAFNPFKKAMDGIGLKLMTSLLECRYRYMKGFNCFRFYVVVSDV